jgi:hypothetical protein
MELRELIIEALKKLGAPGRLAYKYKEGFLYKNLTILEEESYGGEGQGDEYWMVIKVIENDTKNVSFWEIPGWYRSDDGGEYEIDNIFEVVSKEKVITVWEQKK